jgi:hypothetical protein
MLPLPCRMNKFKKAAFNAGTGLAWIGSSYDEKSTQHGRISADQASNPGPATIQMMLLLC